MGTARPAFAGGRLDWHAAKLFLCARRGTRLARLPPPAHDQGALPPPHSMDLRLLGRLALTAPGAHWLRSRNPFTPVAHGSDRAGRRLHLLVASRFGQYLG